MEQYEAVRSATVSDVIIEPYMADWKEQQAVGAPVPDLALEETGKPVDSLQWPPRVLDNQPLLLLQKQYRDLASQPGSLGAVSPRNWFRDFACFYSI